VTVRGNSADNGGGIFNDQGHVDLHQGSIVGDDDLLDESEMGNNAVEEGGGVYTIAPPPENGNGNGNGSGTFILDDSSVQGNTALEHGGGIYNGGDDGFEGDRVEIVNGSNVTGNTAGATCSATAPEDRGPGGDGGGIWSNARGEFDDDQITPNSPGVFVDNSTVDDNQAINCQDQQQMIDIGYGGGIYNEGGHVEITGGSTIGPDNEAEQGGGIWTSGGVRIRIEPPETLAINETTITGNSAATHGGGIYAFFDNVDIANSVIDNNTAEDGDGGGIWFEGEDFGEGFIGLSVQNSTISNNQALDIPIDNASGLGGGIYGHGGPVFLDSVTLEDNVADVGGGSIALGENEVSTSPTANLHNTIIANGLVDGLPQNCAADGGIFFTDGFNLSTEDDATDACGLDPAGTDLLASDPLLGPLQDNGGPTFTHALGDGSPAIDSGPIGDGCPERDQRGVNRPEDGNGDGNDICDRGAYEREDQPITAVGPNAPVPVPPAVCDITGTVAPDILLGTDAPEDICGLAGNDTIRGGGGNDNLFGNEDDDTLDGGPGDDSLVGGTGSDTGDYSGAPGSVDADLNRGTAVGTGASTDALFELENLTGSAFDDVLSGNAGANRLKGKRGNDRLVGRGGNDTMRGARGNDDGRGGAGNDTIRAGHDRDDLRGGAGNDLLTGGQKKDDLRGNQGDDELRGGGHDDDLNGNAGNDECNGGSGNNTLINCES
jgi:predicted outer membrane repeat protein